MTTMRIGPGLNTRGVLSRVETAVLESIAYSDIFDFPVTPTEVWRTLPVEATLAEVESALRPGSVVGTVVASPLPYYCLVGREHLVEVRRQRELDSKRLLRSARFYGSLIGRLPFVRMVAVTGSLAAENAHAGDDIDFIIVTAPGRVWTARAFAMLVVRLAALRGLTLCPNFVLSEDSLALAGRDLYTARELAQMLPVAGDEVHRRMMRENGWLHGYLPNLSSPGPARPVPASRVKALFERLLRTRAGERLEGWIYERKAAELRALAGDGSHEAVFDRTMCKGHFEGHGERTRQALAERLRTLQEAVL